MFDTAEFQADTKKESIVGEALEPMRDKVVFATKCGVHLYPGDISGHASGRMIIDSMPAVIRKSLEGSMLCPYVILGNLFAYLTYKQLNAFDQLLIGIVHFFDAFDTAIQNNFCALLITS